MSESNGDVLTFSEVPEEREIKIKDSAGVVRKYIGRGLSGDQLSEWLDRVFQRRQGVDGKPSDKKLSIKESQDDDIDLIQLCLFDENGANLGRDRIKAWPAVTRNGLSNLFQEMNGIKAGKV